MTIKEAEKRKIYEEALDILDDIMADSFSDPQDESNDCYMINFKQIIEIEEAIKKAQKQEKLLELYKDLYYAQSFIENTEKQIKELENDK